MVDFFPKPGNKIITVGEALKNCKPKQVYFYKDGTWGSQAWDIVKIGKSLNNYNTSITKNGNGYGHHKLSPNCVCRTVTKSPYYSKTSLMHWKEKRAIAIEELKILCSFPENWILGKSFELAWNRLGNAVMPKFMQAIAEHVKNTFLKKENPTVISTFAGTGGSSLGYKWAGYKELLAIDFNAHAVECFKLNFPEVPCWHKSVLDITGKEILEFCKINKGDLDIFDGSPPCQGFSTAGKREVNDLRNDLFKRYIYFINELQPKVFIMENVSGMVKGKMKGRFIEIMRELKSTGYEVKCKLMNSKYYGVPQSRERLIFIGIRKDILIDKNKTGWDRIYKGNRERRKEND